jgi:drug/metabolite transporter (DMT)-like permease
LGRVARFFVASGLTAGFLYGLGAALAFAVADPGAAFLSRRIGALAATLVVAAAGLPLVLLAALIFDEPVVTSVPLTLFLMVLGVGAALSYIGLYYAFAVGPLAVVGPITSMFGTVTVVLAVIFLGERLTPIEAVAVVMAATGALLGAVEFRGLNRLRFAGHGPVVAVGAVIVGSAISVLLQHPIRAIGWIPAVIGVRAGVAVTAGVCLVFAGSSMWPEGASILRPSRTATSMSSGLLALAVCIGMADAVAFSSFSLGLAKSPAWLVAIVAAASPMVLLLAGLAVLKERLQPLQWLGVALVFFSLALLAFDGIR